MNKRLIKGLTIGLGSTAIAVGGYIITKQIINKAKKEQDKDLLEKYNEKKQELDEEQINKMKDYINDQSKEEVDKDEESNEDNVTIDDSDIEIGNQQ